MPSGAGSEAGESRLPPAPSRRGEPWRPPAACHLLDPWAGGSSCSGGAQAVRPRRRARGDSATTPRRLGRRELKRKREMFFFRRFFPISRSALPAHVCLGRLLDNWAYRLRNCSRYGPILQTPGLPNPSYSFRTWHHLYKKKQVCASGPLQSRTLAPATAPLVRHQRFFPLSVLGGWQLVDS